MTNWMPEELAEALKNKDLSVAGEQPVVSGRKFVGYNKFHVAPKAERTYNGQVFHSKREADFARRLDLLIAAGDLDFYQRQVRFLLPGGTEYRLDFLTWKRTEEAWLHRFIEVKGFPTRLGEIKRKQCQELYKIHIEVV